MNSIQSDTNSILDRHISGYHRISLSEPVHVIFASQNLCDMTGYEKSDFEGERADLNAGRADLYAERVDLNAGKVDLYAEKVHPQDRQLYVDFVNKLKTEKYELSCEYRLIKKDGSVIFVRDRVSVEVLEDGTVIGNSVLHESNRYMDALSHVYDTVFEFRPDVNTLKCLRAGKLSSLKRFENIQMQMDDALKKWLLDDVVQEQHKIVGEFFKTIASRKLSEIDDKPMSISYMAKSHSGNVNHYSGIFFKLDDMRGLYCYRNTQKESVSTVLKYENDFLKARIRDIFDKLSEGVAAFEVNADGLAKPLYASENMYEFFGYTEEEWRELSETYTPVKKFVENSEASYDEFQKLFTTGEAQFTYFDYDDEKKKYIKAIHSRDESDPNGSTYILLYDVDSPSSETVETKSGSKVSIRTFGYFDVFVGDKPIPFRNKKSKELLALMVDRRGGYITSSEAISFLWEDEPVNTVTMSRYRKVALRLKNALEEYGIVDIVESVDGKRRIVTEKVDCDLYNYLTGEPEYAHLFKGSYLSNYSWGEITLGDLMNTME